jgi:hypothetical protein
MIGANTPIGMWFFFFQSYLSILFFVLLNINVIYFIKRIYNNLDDDPFPNVQKVCTGFYHYYF